MHGVANISIKLLKNHSSKSNPKIQICSSYYIIFTNQPTKTAILVNKNTVKAN